MNDQTCQWSVVRPLAEFPGGSECPGAAEGMLDEHLRQEGGQPVGDVVDGETPQ